MEWDRTFGVAGRRNGSTGRRVTDAQQEELKRSGLKQNTVLIEGFKALTVKSTNYQRVFSLDTNCVLNC